MNKGLVFVGPTLLIIIAVVSSVFLIGPSRRIFVEPVKVLPVSGVEEISTLWDSMNLKGRVAIVFTRRLNAIEQVADGTEVKYLQSAMRRGVVRKAYHVIPDASWQEVSRNLANRPYTRKTGSGFLLLFEEVRVVVLPLSKFERIEERALIVLDASIWSPMDLLAINRLVSDKLIPVDCMMILNGSDSLLSMFSKVALNNQNSLVK
jgi:hypothetical protein